MIRSFLFINICLLVHICIYFIYVRTYFLCGLLKVGVFYTHEKKEKTKTKKKKEIVWLVVKLYYVLNNLVLNKYFL